MRTAPKLVWLAALAAGACGGDAATPDATPPGPDADTRPAPAQNWNRDVVSTDLAFDVSSLTATATVTLAGDDSQSASLDVGDLTIESVRAGDVDLLTARDGTRLDVGVPDDGSPVAITIDYAFTTHTGFEGYMTSGVTLTWPYFCGNLFPCTTDPADGLTFTVDVTGVPDGETAVYPQTIPAPAPSYMVAFAVGDYSYAALGTTTAGTEVGVYYLPGGESNALAGTQYLVDYVDFYEQTYGAYTFGPKIAAVSAHWGPGALGGMEHHPFFHVADGAMAEHEVHAHEAAHGWFGDGIRIACWEDFVLSEGVVQYLTVRAIEAAEGTTAADALWSTMQSRLESAVASGDTEAYPDGCDQIDILTDPLWSRIPYEKGAFFMRAVEQRVGRAELDAALAAFYADNVGQARHMSDLLAAIEASTGMNIDDLADAWLRGLGIPM